MSGGFKIEDGGGFKWRFKVALTSCAGQFATVGGGTGGQVKPFRLKGAGGELGGKGFPGLRLVDEVLDAGISQAIVCRTQLGARLHLDEIHSIGQTAGVSQCATDWLPFVWRAAFQDLALIRINE